MTRLKINVNQADKTLSCEGVVAVGEDIELVVDPGGNISDYDQLRVRFRFMNEDVAVFPLDYDIDEWTKVTTLDSAVYKGIMTLNTEQLLFCFSELPERATMTFDVVVDQLPDDDGTDDVPTLFGRGRIKIRNWSPNMNITDVQEGVRPVSLLEIADRKIDKVTGATPGHLPVFNADGGLESSGVSLESLKGKVARSDFTNVQEISVNTIKNVAGKVNEILAILKGTAGAVALALFALAAQGVPFEEVLPTTAVDTNTVGIAHERIEGAITAAAGIGGTVSNIVTKSYVEGLGPEIGLTTNAVQDIVTNALPAIVPWDPETQVLNIGSQGGIQWGDTPVGILLYNGHLIFNDGHHSSAQLIGTSDLADYVIRTNLPALPASATVGELVDHLNAIVNAMRKEEE